MSIKSVWICKKCSTVNEDSTVLCKCCGTVKN